MANKNQKANASLDVNDALSKSEAFITKYKKSIIAAIVAIIVIVGGGYSLKKFYFEPREDKAQSLLTLGEQYIAQEDYDKALNGDGQFPGYLKIAKDYSFTDAANIATLQAGLAYAHKGDYKNAIKFLEDFSPKGDKSISPSAVGALANCYAAEKQTDKAIETFKKAAKMANNEALSPLFLLEAGKLYENAGNKEEARKLYEQIKSDYPQSPLSVPQASQDDNIADPEIDKYIERVK